MSAETQRYVNDLLQSFRELVVGIEHEEQDLKRRLRNLRLSSSHRISDTLARVRNNSTSESTNATVTASPTIDDPSVTNTNSSGAVSTGTSTAGSTRPPSYRSALKPPVGHEESVPLPPARTKRRNSQTQTLPDYSRSYHKNTTHTVHHRTLNIPNNMSNISRGALIVLEGLDRVGKSTLATKLVEHLQKTRRQVSYCRFPDRDTPIGRVIDDLLKNGSKHVEDHAMHLLFSANRWEFNKTIRQTLNQGTTVIVDRYAYSGIAYSSAKRCPTFEWCSGTEKGLPKPDLVIYLELAKEAQYKRPGFGDERFETEELQELIRLQYEKIIKRSKENWIRIDVENKSPDQVLGEVIIPVKRCLESCSEHQLGDLDFQ